MTAENYPLHPLVNAYWCSKKHPHLYIIISFSGVQVKGKVLKLKDVTISFSAVSPCEDQNALSLR
jgi:hypothetical protein